MSQSEPKGIGGWLLLLALALISSPGSMRHNAQIASEAFSSPVISSLITIGSQDYDWRWSALYVCEVQVTVVLTGFCFALLPLFFLKLRSFPLAFGLLASGLVSVNTAKLLLAMVMPDLNPQYQTAIIVRGSAVSVAVVSWSIYLFRSRRARNTFTRSLALKSFPPFFSIYEKGP